MFKTIKTKTDKKPMVKPTVVPKPKPPKRSVPKSSGAAGRKGALGATTSY